MELRSGPVQVRGLNLGGGAISAGGTFEEFFSCGRTSWAIHCWGGNSMGQIGQPGSGDSLVPKQVELPIAQLEFLASPASGKPGETLNMEPRVQIQDILGNPTFSAVSATTISLSLTGGPGVLSCTGGTSRVADMGTALFAGCVVSAQGTYTLRATSGSVLPAEAALGIVAPRARLMMLSSDTAPPAPTAAYLGSGLFAAGWQLEPEQVVCGRVEKLRAGVRVYYAYRSPDDGCDFGVPTTFFPTGFTFDVHFGFPAAELEDVRSGDVYCFHLTRTSASGFGSDISMDPAPCVTVGVP
jgi:hypothetical protein